MELYFSPYYFGIYLMIVCGLTTLYICFFKFRWNKCNMHFAIFPIYFICSIVQMILTLMHSFGSASLRVTLKNADIYSANIFVLIEFFLFCFYFLNVYKILIFKRYIFLILTFFPIFCLSYWLYQETFFIFPALITVVEGFLLIIACLFYFFEL